MNSSQKTLSSKEAASIFKNEVDKSLRLIGFLNNTDKQDVWKYWEAVSSAIKIAVNGKGHVLSTLFNNQRREGLKETLQNSSTDITTVHVPLSRNTKGQRRLRILGIINKQVTDDYIEVSDEAEFHFRHDNISIEDSSQLTSVPVDLIAQISQLGDSTSYSENYEVHDCSVIESDNSNTMINDISLCASLRETREETLSKLPKAREVNVKAAMEKPGTGFSFGVRQWNLANHMPMIVKENETDVKTKEKDSDTSTVDQTVRNNLRASISSSKSCVKERTNHNSFDREKIVRYSTDGGKSNIRFECCEVDSGIYGESQLKVLSPASNTRIRNDSEKCDIDNEVKDCSSESEFNSQFVHSTLNRTETTTSVLGDSFVFEEQPSKAKGGFKSKSETETEKCEKSVKNCSQLVDSIKKRQQLQNSPSDIETIISALEEELKKTGPSEGIHSISITSSADGGTTLDIHARLKEDVVELGGNHDIIMVQNVGDVIWNQTSEGSVQVLDTTPTLIDSVHQVTSVVASDDDSLIHSSIDTQYDVVEYEVKAEKIKNCRGAGSRKRKREKDLQKEQPAIKNKDTVDRTCPMCHRILTYSSSMAAHMRIHTGDRPYSCGQCDRKFTTKANRDRHESTHVGLKPFKCVECQKSFTEKRSLKIHMRSHTGERPFVCTVCRRGFAQKCTLMVHMDRHTNKKGHLCDLCGKAFRQKSQLDVHVKRHNRQANYPCPECSIRCYTKGDLDRHMIKHTGERPFSCSLCSKTFTRKQYLMDHENTHYGRKPYKCSVCAMAFHDMGSCHRHVKKHREQDEASGIGENDVRQEPATILTADDYACIVKDSQAGKILTLRDGSQALVTAVNTEADGATVYHLTCVRNQQEDTKKMVTMTKEEIIDNGDPVDNTLTVRDFKYEMTTS